MICRFLWRSLLVLAWATPAASQPSPEETRGLAWLQAQVRADGSLSGEATSIAAPFQARSEAALTLQRSGLAPAALIDLVGSETDEATEALARRALVLATVGRDASGTLATLRARQNPDGGFGGTVGYESNPLDTALALLALGTEPPGAAVPAALAYLRNTQATDGSHDVAGRADVYVSALVLSALRAHASRFDVGALLTGAIAFLQAQQLPGDLWGGSVFLTSIAYDALHAFLPLEPTASSVRAFLVSRQAADGSWDAGDPYATALALRALALTSVVPFNPTRSLIRGRIVDAQTDQPLGGVAVVLTGAVAGASNSGPDGVFEFRDLPPGPYTLQLSLAQYEPVDVAIATQPGRITDLSVLRLSKQASTTTGTVRGVVTDAETGAPLLGAVVSVASGPSALTDAGGAYQITDVAPGAVVVEARKAGYASLAGSGNLRAGGVLVFSPALAPGSNNPTATLVGVASRASDGSPLPGVTILVTGASSASTVTGASGAYSLTGLSPGIVQLRASLAGFDDVAGAMTIVGNSTATFSPQMYPTGSTPGGGSSRVSGVVVDAGTDAPLRGVQVSSSVGPTVVTGGDGRFTFQGSGAPQELIFAVPGYVGGALALNWGLAGLSDIGEVRLVPVDAAELLPDLSPSRLERSGLVTDPQSLAMGGAVTLFVANTGNAVTQAETSVTVFEDRDGDGRFDPVFDATLGSEALPAGIGVGETPVTIPVSGAVSFRDGVLHAVVDFEQAVAESDEDDNTDGFESCESSQLPFIDNFDDGDTEGWQTLLGRGTTPGMVVNGEWSRPFGAEYTGSTQWTDYRAEVKLRFPAGHSNDAGIVFRARNPSDFFSLRMQSGLVRLMRFTSAGFTALRSAGITVLSHPERYHTLRVDVAGRWARTYINNQLIFEHDGLDWEAGAAGIEQDGVLVHWDDFRFSPLTVVEDFDDGNADGWRPLSYGSAPGSVVGGEYVRNGAGSSAFGSTSWKNYTAEVRLRFPNGPSNDGGLVFVAKDTNNWAWVTINGGLIRMAVAGQGVVRSTNVVLPDPTGWQTIKAELRGRAVRIHVNGQFLFSYDQLPWDNGAVGTIQDGLLVHYDDLKITFAEPVGAPDLSASRLVIEDGGAAASRFSVRAGVGGGSAAAGLPVAFYNGNPGAGGALLGTAVTTKNLTAGQFEDVSFSFPGSLSGLAEVVAGVDDDGTGQGRLAECNEGNNRLGLPIAEVPGVFLLQLATDQPSYGPNTDVHATATLANLGSLARLAQVRFVIETADGVNELTELPATAPVLVVPGTNVAVGTVWNTSTTLTGSYRVRAELLAPGVAVGAVAPFGIVSAPGALATARLSADKTSYLPSDVVRLSARAANVTLNTPLEDLRVTTSVRNPDGSPRFTRTETVPQLVPGARREYEYPLPLAFAAAGAYAATLSVQTASGAELAAAATSFTVQSTASTGSGLGGSLVASPETVPLGEAVSLAAVLTNQGNEALAGLPVVVRVIDPVAETVLDEFSRSVDLAQGATLPFSESWTSRGSVGATYVATVSASPGATSRVLAQATITIAAPTPVRLVTGTLSVNPELVPQGDSVAIHETLRNDGNVAVSGVPFIVTIVDTGTGLSVAEWSDSPSLAPGESFQAVRSFLANAPVGTVFDVVLKAPDIGSGELARARFTVGERPVRLDVIQELAREARVLAYVDCGGHDKKGHDERRHDGRRGRGKRCTAGKKLESVFEELGVRHLVTHDEWRFVKELRSGRYNVYFLAGRMCQEHSDVAAELREAVRRGAGLLVDGSFGDESEKDDVSGVERDGHLDFSRVTMQLTGPVYTPARLDIVGGAWRFEPTTGTVQATVPGQRCKGDDDHDDEDGDDDDDDDDDRDDHDHDGDRDRRRDDQGHRDSEGDHRQRNIPRDLAAIVSHDYGEGRAIAFAFDFLPSYAKAKATEREAWKRLLQESLAHLTPEPQPELGPLDYVVLETDVTNTGAGPVEVELAFTLPPGLLAEDSEPPAAPDANGVLRVRAQLAIGETRQFRIGLRMPEDPGQYTVETGVSACVGVVCSEQSTHAFPLEVVAAIAEADGVLADLRGLGLSRSSDRAARDEAVRRLGRGLSAFSRRDFEKAIGELVQAAKHLGRISRADVSRQRLAVARLLAEAERHWWREHP